MWAPDAATQPLGHGRVPGSHRSGRPWAAVEGNGEAVDFRDAVAQWRRRREGPVPATRALDPGRGSGPGTASPLKRRELSGRPAAGLPRSAFGQPIDLTIAPTRLTAIKNLRPTRPASADDRPSARGSTAEGHWPLPGCSPARVWRHGPGRRPGDASRPPHAGPTAYPAGRRACFGDPSTSTAANCAGRHLASCSLASIAVSKRRAWAALQDLTTRAWTYPTCGSQVGAPICSTARSHARSRTSQPCPGRSTAPSAEGAILPPPDLVRLALGFAASAAPAFGMS